MKAMKKEWNEFKEFYKEAERDIYNAFHPFVCDRDTEVLERGRERQRPQKT